MSLTSEDKEWLQTWFRGELGTALKDLESRLTERFSADLEAVETKLLTEFHKWASPTEMRLKSNSLVMQAFDLELSNIKDRLNKLDPPIPPH